MTGLTRTYDRRFDLLREVKKGVFEEVTTKLTSEELWRINYYVPGILCIYSIIVRAILQSDHYFFPLFSYSVQGHTANNRQNLIHTPIYMTPTLLQGQTLELEHLGSKLSSTTYELRDPETVN